MKTIQHSTQRGALLLELLVAISILAIILSIGSESVFVSMQSGKISSETDVAMGLASETLEATRAISDEKWQNISGVIKGSHYVATSTSVSGKWALVSGDETIPLNTALYTRYVTIENVSRDLSTREIENIYNADHDDPSTQRVAVTVSWQGSGSPVTMNDYFLRWRNKICKQTDWAGGTGSGAKNCPDTTYGSKDAAVDTAGGTLKLQ
ncbi:MAG: hypothetical protein M0P64_00675 [Candidatus Pacebacteria bacterium]|jgi:type II secretory pathway pseudopilin PulG|nr:hypothetical protein [Candidatus Paceibacterota bacterium]